MARLRGGTVPSISHTRLETREAFQAARGVAILVVVLFHADGWLSQYARYMPFSVVRAFLQFITMPVFFLSVGMSLAPAFERDNAPVYIARRAVHYGYLFLLWTVIDCAVTAVVTGGRSLTLAAWTKAFVHPPGVLWFLYALTAQLLLFGCLGKVPKVAQAAVCVALLFVGTALHGNVVVGATLNMMFVYIGARHSKWIYEALASRAGSIFAWCLPGYLLLALAIWTTGRAYIPIVHEVTCMIGMLCLVSFWKLLTRSWMSRFASHLGRVSFQIYVIHMYFVQLFAVGVIWMGVDLLAMPALQYLFPLCSVLFAVLASFLVGSLIKDVRWLFGKPRIVAIYIDPIVVAAIDGLATFGQARRYSRVRSPDLGTR